MVDANASAWATQIPGSDFSQMSAPGPTNDTRQSQEPSAVDHLLAGMHNIPDNTNSHDNEPSVVHELMAGLREFQSRSADAFEGPGLQSALQHLEQLGQPDPVLSTISPSELMGSTNPDITQTPLLPIIPGQESLTLPVLGSLNTLESSEPDEEQNEDDNNDYLITLPLAANMRPAYLRKIASEKDAITELMTALSHAREPDPAAVDACRKVLAGLLDVCDLPSFDGGVGDLSGEAMTRHATGTNSKMLFVYELLHALRDAPLQVLILVRPGRAYDYLEAILKNDGFKFRRAENSQSQNEDAGPLSVVLASTGQSPALHPSFANVVIGYDEASRSSGLLTPYIVSSSERRPMVLTLVASYTVDHLDVVMSRKMESIERLNALFLSTLQVWSNLINPPFLGPRGEPHDIAQNFASLIQDPRYDWAWVPETIPESALDVFESSQADQLANIARISSSLEQPMEPSRSASRKRELEDSDDRRDGAKRAKGIPGSLLEESRRRPQFSEAVESVLSLLPISNGPVAEISVAHIEAIIRENEVLKEKLGVKAKVSAALANRLDALNKEHQGYLKTFNVFQKRYMEAVGDRGKFEKERDVAFSQVDKIKSEAAAAKSTIAILKDENAGLKDQLHDATKALAKSEVPDLAKLGQLQQKLQEAETMLAGLQKKLVVQDKDLEHARNAYQEASSRAAELGNENRALAAEKAVLTQKASENRVRIHEIQTSNERIDFDLLRRQAEATLAERERELEKLRDELRTLKGRRETRGQSVPRSPRLGVMSPRGNGNGGAAGARSRGTSPVPAMFGDVGMISGFQGNPRIDQIRRG